MNSGIQQFEHVLEALDVPRPGNISVREFVDDDNGRLSRQNRGRANREPRRPGAD